MRAVVYFRARVGTSSLSWEERRQVGTRYKEALTHRPRKQKRQDTWPRRGLEGLAIGRPLLDAPRDLAGDLCGLGGRAQGENPGAGLAMVTIPHPRSGWSRPHIVPRAVGIND